MQDLNDKVTGGQLSATEWNEVPSELQNIIVAFGQSLTSADLNQLGKGVSGYAAAGNFYSTSGAANAIVLSTLGTIQAPPAYLSGMQVRFKAAASNTGAVTVNVATLGVKQVRDQFDAPLIANDFIASNRYTLTYDPLFNGGLGAFALQKAGGAVILNALSRNYIDGFILSNNTAATPASDLDISAGQCKDSTNGFDFNLAGSIGKRITSAWAEGGTPAVPAGGMPVGLVATNNTWYRVFAIQKATSQVDIGFDTNAGAATLLNGANAGALGYTKYRQIGWIRYGLGVIVKFIQTRDVFTWTDLQIQINGTTPATGSYTQALFAPPDTTGKVCARIEHSGAATFLAWMGAMTQTQPTPVDASTAVVGFNQWGSGSTTIMDILLDSSSQIRYKTFYGGASGTFYMKTLGWTDARGKQ